MYWWAAGQYVAQARSLLSAPGAPASPEPSPPA
jgi:hypothetical protein